MLDEALYLRVERLKKGYIEPFRLHAWVNIAVALLIRNVARAELTIVRDGEAVTSGPVFTLFRDVNPPAC